jgi:hypothetical protein
MRRSRLVFAAVLFSSLALVACGGGSKAGSSPSSARPSASSSAGGGLSAAAWVSQFCQFGKTLSDQIQERTDALQNFTPSTLQEAKQTFVDYLTFVLNEFTSLSNEFTSLGTPNVSGGQDAIDRAKNQFTLAQGELQQVLNQAKDLPTDDPNAFTQGIDAITASLDRTQPFGGPNGTLSFGQTELDSAFQADPTCQELNKSSGGGASPSPSV